MVKLILSKINMVKLSINKVNKAKQTNEQIFYG
jgi:hypothetical protein